MGKELEIDFKAESFLACKENGTLRLKAALSRQFSSFSRRDSGKDKAKHKLAMRKFINESRNEAGECLIHVASSRNAFGCIQILLENGADILAADLESKWTPLHKAVYYGAFASIKALHAFSTESSPGKWEKCISALDFEGKTPIDLFHWRESKWTQWGARLLRKDFPKRSESIQEKGFFLSCGSASNFQLGYDTNGTFQNTPRVSKHLAEKNILHVSLSKYAGAAVDDNGSCFVWGVNRKGLLGLEDKNETTVIAPTLLSALQNYKISQIACGKYHMVAVTQDGLVFSWGHGHLGHVQASGCFIREKQISLIPKPVVGLEKFKIAKVSVDENRTFFISADGELLLLGLSLDRSIIHTTVHRIRRFCESPLLDIVSQNNHIIILTTKGKVYEYNSSSNRFKNVPFPCDQYAINMHTKVSRRIIFISSCTEYSLAVSNTGHIFSWSHDSREGRGYEPFRLKFLKRFRFVSVSCSSSLSCGITVDGDVISWRPLEGSSSRCRFGWGKNPTRVEGIRNASMVVVDDESILFIEQLRSLCNSKTDPGSSLMDVILNYFFILTIVY